MQDKTSKLGDLDKRELVGMALRFFAANVDARALFAMGLYAPYEELSDDEFASLRDKARRTLRGLAEEVEKGVQQ